MFIVENLEKRKVKKLINFNATNKTTNILYSLYAFCIYIFIVHPHILKDSDSILTLFYIIIFHLILLNILNMLFGITKILSEF